MPVNSHVERSVADIIALWLAIHGGDPGPDQSISRLSGALLIHHLAASLSPEVGKQVRQAVGRELSESVGQLVRQ